MSTSPRRFSTCFLQQVADQRLSLLTVVLLLVPFAHGQTRASFPKLPATCPIQFEHLDPSNNASVRVRNTSGKTIVGLVFFVAIADATEHWKWYHWDFDDTRPVRKFGWNKTITSGQRKTLTWTGADLDFEHGGGGAFVLTSALFDDGSLWEEVSGQPSCTCLWYNSHKKGGLIRPPQLALPK